MARILMSADGATPGATSDNQVKKTPRILMKSDGTIIGKSAANKGTDTVPAPKTDLFSMIKSGAQKAGQAVKEVAQTAAEKAPEFGLGFLKGAGKSVIDLAKSAGQTAEVLTNPIGYASQKAAGLKTPGEAAGEFVSKQAAPIEPQLEPKTPIEKAGAITENIAELAIPAGEAAKGIKEGSKLKEALSLSADELNKVNGKKLEFLSKDSLAETGKTIGGFLRKKAYDVSDKVKPLLDEFGQHLTGKTPEENVDNIRKFMKDTWQNTKNLFTSNEKAVNESTVRRKLTNALNQDKSTTYATEYEKKNVVRNAVDNFINSVKKGTNKGLEEARNAWYSESKKMTGKLSDANKVLHDAIKTVIKDTLPENEQKLYDEYKKTTAKANDVKEILKAKVKASVGTSKYEKLAPYIKGGAGGALIAGAGGLLDKLFGKK